MARTFNTIHIFGYGETQIISTENSGKVESTRLQSLNPLVDFIKGLRPESVVESELHAIHIFDSGEVKYLGKVDEFSPKVKKSYSFKVSELEAREAELYDELFGKLYEDLVKAVKPVVS